MCSPTVMSVVEADTARRSFLRSAGAAAVGLGAAAVGVRAESLSTGSSRAATTVHFEDVVDLTHVLEPNIRRARLPGSTVGRAARSEPWRSCEGREWR